jgi:hypothetical protein
MPLNEDTSNGIAKIKTQSINTALCPTSGVKYEIRKI